MRFPKPPNRQDSYQNHHDSSNAREASFQFQNKVREQQLTDFEFHLQSDQFDKKYVNRLVLKNEHGSNHQAHQFAHHDNLLLFQDNGLVNLYSFLDSKQKFAYGADSSLALMQIAHQ